MSILELQVQDKCRMFAQWAWSVAARADMRSSRMRKTLIEVDLIEKRQREISMMDSMREGLEVEAWLTMVALFFSQLPIRSGLGIRKVGLSEELNIKGMLASKVRLSCITWQLETGERCRALPIAHNSQDLASQDPKSREVPRKRGNHESTVKNAAPSKLLLRSWMLQATERMQTFSALNQRSELKWKSNYIHFDQGKCVRYFLFLITLQVTKENLTRMKRDHRQEHQLKTLQRRGSSISFSREVGAMSPQHMTNSKS